MSEVPQAGQKLLGPLRSAEQAWHRIMAPYCKVSTRERKSAGRSRILEAAIRRGERMAGASDKGAVPNALDTRPHIV